MYQPNYHPTQHLELFTANLLSKRQSWQALTAHVLPHAIVLIARLGNPTQTGFIQGLGYSLQKQGMRVFVLSVG